MPKPKCIAVYTSELARDGEERDREREEMLSFRFDGVRRRRLSMARLTQLQQPAMSKQYREYHHAAKKSRV